MEIKSALVRHMDMVNLHGKMAKSATKAIIFMDACRCSAYDRSKLSVHETCDTDVL